MSLPRYYDEQGNAHECNILDRNGNLILVENRETGECDWKCPFEVDE